MESESESCWRTRYSQSRESESEIWGRANAPRGEGNLTKSSTGDWYSQQQRACDRGLPPESPFSITPRSARSQTLTSPMTNPSFQLSSSDVPTCRRDDVRSVRCARSTRLAHGSDGHKDDEDDNNVDNVGAAAVMTTQCSIRSRVQGVRYGRRRATLFYTWPQLL